VNVLIHPTFERKKWVFLILVPGKKYPETGGVYFVWALR